MTPLREGGSLPGLVEGDDDGLYVVKFRAAGQGVKALIAEIVVGELARTLGLAVPEIVLVEIPAELGRTEPDPEINELVTASAGLNVGLDFLPGALDYTPAQAGLIAPELASAIVWLDALTTNVDRSARNPNLLLWHGAPWLIDHGAALYHQHAAIDLPARARDPFVLIAQHVLLPRASELAMVDGDLAAMITPARVEAILALIPPSFLAASGRPGVAEYGDYLLTRAAAPRPFLATAVDAREHDGA
ncbi:HipA family kinase [Conexibacter sp. DBS9H8]|uniref:HipA family kinase n=1 Tax=Conexibacter sp. DBS9H8 TaxID=2937801 RepID=UPI00200DAFDF|nr:HipA family kinase [Conexibacter sp. DBS9H8]